jgi:starch synthase
MALTGALRRALTAYSDEPRWREIQRRGMRADFSWREAAGRYTALYERARARPATRLGR